MNAPRHLGYNINPRDLRKTYLTLRIELKCDAVTAKELLGSKDLRVVLDPYREPNLDAMSQASQTFSDRLQQATDSARKNH